MGSRSRAVVEPVHVFEGGVLDLVEVPSMERVWVGSARSCTDPITDSARALSYESPTDPTDGSMPASARRLV